MYSQTSLELISCFETNNIVSLTIETPWLQLKIRRNGEILIVKRFAVFR